MILPKINANFILLVGERGVGKKYTLRESYKDAQFNVYWAPDISVDTIRTIIREAYKRHNTVFIIADADNMSITAKNALLKVVEECPNGNSFILTLQDENNTLPTIRSRATILRMQNPTPDELFQYFWEKYPDGNPNDAEKASAICSTYGEVDIVQKFGAMNFYDYVEKVIDYIDQTSTANALKIANEIAFKDEEDKYDLILFWKAFVNICIERANGANDLVSVNKYGAWTYLTSRHLVYLRTTGVNKRALFETWIIKIRNCDASSGN